MGTTYKTFELHRDPRLKTRVERIPPQVIPGNGRLQSEEQEGIDRVPRQKALEDKETMSAEPDVLDKILSQESAEDSEVPSDNKMPMT